MSNFPNSFFLYSVTERRNASGELFYEQSPFKSVKELVDDIYGQDIDVARVIGVSLTAPGQDVTKEAAQAYLNKAQGKELHPDELPDWVCEALPGKVQSYRDDYAEAEFDARATASWQRSHNYRAVV